MDTPAQTGPETSPRARRAAAFAALVACQLVLGIGLGSYALIDPDEGRNATAAREVAADGTWLVPTYNGLPFLDKPLVWFDSAALAMRLLGASELAARFPSWLFTGLTAGLVGWVALRRWGERRAALAAFACLASPLAIAYARIAIFDATLTFFVVAALLALWAAVDAEETAAARWLAVAAWAAIGLGVLTKGPVAIVVPLLAAVPYAAVRRRLRRVAPLAGLGVFLAVAVPWALVVEQRLPGFLRYALLSESWSRLTTGAYHRQAPVWYFLPYLVGGTLPWCVAAIAAWWPERGTPRAERPEALFPLLWLTVPLVFFSLSQSKRPHYILPLVPAVALLAAAGADTPARLRRAVRAAAGAAAALGILLVVAASVAARLAKADRAALVAPGRRFALAWAALLGLAALAAWIAAARRPLVGSGALALAFCALPALALPLLGGLAETRSARGLAARIEEACPDAPVIAIETIPHSLPFYLRRRLTVSAAGGDATLSNFQVRFWERFAGRPQILDAGRWSGIVEHHERPLVIVVERRRGLGGWLAGHGMRRIEEGYVEAWADCAPRP